MEQFGQNTCFGGRQLRFKHDSSVLDCSMIFSVYLPPQSDKEQVPSLYWLSGLTCTDENFSHKSGAQRYAAEQGIALIIPDTSPRGDAVADDPDRYDLGKGAGFYLNTTQLPWSTHYRMFDYINQELPELVESHLPLIPGLKSIAGHSMGGHGALISSLKNPDTYRSVSAFSPICNPVQCSWGENCFLSYLGHDQETWKQYDATELIKAGAPSLPILIDQGSEDEFLADQLHPLNLQTACQEKSITINLRMREGYDHSYYFITSFIGEHIQYHAEHLNR